MAVLLTLIHALGLIAAAGAKRFNRIPHHGFVLNRREIVLIVNHGGGQDGHALIHLDFLIDIDLSDLGGSRILLTDVHSQPHGVQTLHKLGGLILQGSTVQRVSTVKAVQFIAGCSGKGDVVGVIAGLGVAHSQHGMGVVPSGDIQTVVLEQLVFLGQLSRQTIVQNEDAVLHISHVHQNRNYHTLVGVIADLHPEQIGAGVGIVHRQIIVGNGNILIIRCVAVGENLLNLGHIVGRQIRNLPRQRVARLSCGGQNVRNELGLCNAQVMTRPLVVHGIGGDEYPHLILAGQGGAIYTGRCSGVDHVVKHTRLNLRFRQPIGKAPDGYGAVGPQAAARFHYAVRSQARQEVLQLRLICKLNGDGIQLRASRLIEAVYIGDQVGYVQLFAVDVTNLAAGSSQAIGGIQLDADGVVGEGQVIEVDIAVVGHGEPVLNRQGLIHNAAVLHLAAALIGSLVGGHFGVGNADIGVDAHVGAEAMALQIEEFKGVDLAVLQVQIVLILVQFNGFLGNAVGAADIHHQLVIDEQIDVVVAFEVEEQIVLLVVNKLAFADQSKVEVSVGVLAGKILACLNARILKIGRCGHTIGVAAAAVHNGQEGIEGSPKVTLIAEFGLARSAGIADSAVGSIILYRTLCAGCIRIVRKTGVEDVGFPSVRGSTLGQHQIVIVAHGLIVGAGHEDTVEQEVRGVIVGRDVVLAFVPGAHQFLALRSSVTAHAAGDVLPEPGGQVKAVIAVRGSTTHIGIVPVVIRAVDQRNRQRLLQQFCHIFNSAFLVDRQTVHQLPLQQAKGCDALVSKHTMQRVAQSVAILIQIFCANAGSICIDLGNPGICVIGKTVRCINGIRIMRISRAAQQAEATVIILRVHLVLCADVVRRLLGENLRVKLVAEIRGIDDVDAFIIPISATIVWPVGIDAGNAAELVPVTAQVAGLQVKHTSFPLVMRHIDGEILCRIGPGFSAAGVLIGVEVEPNGLVVIGVIVSAIDQDKIAHTIFWLHGVLAKVSDDPGVSVRLAA